MQEREIDTFKAHVDTWRAMGTQCRCPPVEMSAHRRKIEFMEITVPDAVEKKFEQEVLKFWFHNGGNFDRLLRSLPFRWILKLLQRDVVPFSIDDGCPPFNSRNFTIVKKSGDRKENVYMSCGKCKSKFTENCL